MIQELANFKTCGYTVIGTSANTGWQYPQQLKYQTGNLKNYFALLDNNYLAKLFGQSGYKTFILNLTIY